MKRMKPGETNDRIIQSRLVKHTHTRKHAHGRGGGSSRGRADESEEPIKLTVITVVFPHNWMHMQESITSRKLTQGPLT
jgi:hypothetical protein